MEKGPGPVKARQIRAALVIEIGIPDRGAPIRKFIHPCVPFISMVGNDAVVMEIFQIASDMGIITASGVVHNQAGRIDGLRKMIEIGQPTAF